MFLIKKKKRYWIVIVAILLFFDTEEIIKEGDESKRWNMGILAPKMPNPWNPKASFELIHGSTI